MPSSDRSDLEISELAKFPSLKLLMLAPVQDNCSADFIRQLNWPGVGFSPVLHRIALTEGYLEKRN